MTAAQMEKLCAQTLALLDELEACLQQLPTLAAKFCFESQKSVKELRMIARLETVSNVTQEQAAHVNKINNQLNAWLRKAKQ